MSKRTEVVAGNTGFTDEIIHRLSSIRQFRFFHGNNFDLSERAGILTFRHERFSSDRAEELGSMYTAHLRSLGVFFHLRSPAKGEDPRLAYGYHGLDEDHRAAAQFFAVLKNDIVFLVEENTRTTFIGTCVSDAYSWKEGRYSRSIEWDRIESAEARVLRDEFAWPYPTSESRSLYFQGSTSHLVVRIRESAISSDDFFSFGHNLLSLYRGFLEDSSHAKYERCVVKCRINSPGIIEIIGENISYILGLALFLVVLAGGSMNFDYKSEKRTIKFSMASFSLLERMRAFLDRNKKNAAIAKNIKEMMKQNKIETPKELVRILELMDDSQRAN